MTILSYIDLIIVGLFFFFIFLVGIFERKKITLEDYWVNNRKTNKFILVATIASSYLGVGSLISNAGVAYSGGGFGTILLMSSFFFYFLIFARFFAPKIKEFGDRYRAYTLPDFLEFRYSKLVRIAGMLVNVVTYGFYLSLQILGFGVFVSSVGGLNPILSTILGGLIVIIYTAVGGLRADIRTDVFQFLIMFSLIFIFTPIIILQSGNLGKIFDLPISFLTGQDFAPLYVIIFGFLFLGSTNIVSADIWQRAYAGDSAKNIRWAMNWAGVIVFVFLIAGSLWGIYAKIALPTTGQNLIVPELFKLYLPPAIFGLVLAGFFAAIMSSADTMLLIMSMTLVHDFYQKTLGKELSPEKVLKVSRWTTLILGFLALAIALIIFNVVHLAIDAVSFMVVLIPAIVFGFYWKNAKSEAAFWSIVLGFLTIIIFLFIDPVQAFIPGLLVSFIVFWIANWIVSKRNLKLAQNVVQ